MRVPITLQHLSRALACPCQPLSSGKRVGWSVPRARPCASGPAGEPLPRHSMLRHLTSKIKATGPISVAEYMREVLTNPVSGYYVRNDMLGEDGDFITSPEISQIFGELLGIWCLSEWMAAGKPSTLQLVELGPGRGSLANDVLRVFSQLRAVLGGASVSLHLVEVSPVLAQAQAGLLTGEQNQAGLLTGEQNQAAASQDEPAYHRGSTASGLPVAWYRRLDDVPRGFSIFLAHEFFDALPIHKFQRTERGWREVMVDIEPEEPDKLRFVIAPTPTLASATLPAADEKRQHVEVCPEGGVIVQQMANRIAELGGAALIADYGHDGTKTDTFRGFRRHQLHDVLASPGAADLTADVDFSYLRRTAGGVAGGGAGDVACLGPITQRSFLENMGIHTRLQVLLRGCVEPAARRALVRGVDMLTDPARMGERFQFFCLLHRHRLAPPRQHPHGATPEMKTPALKKNDPRPLPVAGFSELSFS